MSTILIILAAYTIDALFLYFKDTIFAYSIPEGWIFRKTLSSIFLVAIAIASVTIMKRIHRISTWPSPKGLFQFEGWRKVVLLIALFFCTAAASSVLDKLLAKNLGGFKIEGKPAEQIVEEEGKKNIFGVTLGKEASIHLVNGEKVSDLVLTAITEEVFYRWFILGTLLLLTRPGISLFLSSLLFGLSHVFYPLGQSEDIVTILRIALPTLVTGAFFGFVYLRCGLLWAIGFHFLGNVFPEFRSAFWIDYLIYPILICVPLALIILLKRFLWKRV